MTELQRVRSLASRPPADRHRLVVVLRNRSGIVGHAAVGSALLDADWDAAVSMLPTGDEAEGIADFLCDTPTQARRAMDELAEIGDVPFHPRDFAPLWFPPRRGIAAIDWLLANRNTRRARCLLTDAVCAELAEVRLILEQACCPGYRFHFVEAEPGEDLGFAGAALKGGSADR